MKVKRLPSGRYQARWRDKDGIQRARNFIEKPSMEELAALEREGAGNPAVTFREFAEEWFRTYAPVTKGPDTLYTDGIWLKHCLRLFGDRPIGSLKKADLLQATPVLFATPARPTLQKTGTTLKPRSINAILTLAKQIMQAAFELEVIPGNPWATVPNVKVPKQARQTWTPEQKERFLTFCAQGDPGFGVLALVAVETGLRKGELMGLACADLDFERKRIWVRRGYSTRRKVPLDRTKNGEVDDWVPMSSRVREALADRRGRTGEVFERHLFADYYKRLQRRAKAAGVPEIRFHDLRHTFGTHLGDQGLNAFKVKELMRHSSVTMSEKYVHVDQEQLLAAVELVSASGRDSAPQEIPKDMLN